MGLHLVVLAGGSGTRLWPLSRRSVPKHLLPIGPRGSTLLRTTVERVLGLGESVHVVTAASQADLCLAALDGLLGREAIIAEPVARGTGPALGLATRWIARDDPSAVICSTHADAHITDADAYRAALAAAAGWARSSQGLVTVGLVPSYPATGLGYVAVGERRDGTTWAPVPGRLAAATQLCAAAAALPAFTSPGFVEKPDLERAQRFLDEGTYLWNTGLFAWPAAVFEGELAAAAPEADALLAEVVEARWHGDEQRAATRYAELLPIAVDPLIFERTQRLTVVRAGFSWTDVGSWSDLRAVRREGGEGDAGGNVLDGDALLLGGAANCLVSARGGRLVALVGTQDLVVVDTPDALLVVPAAQVQSVRLVTERLAQEGRTDLL